MRYATVHRLYLHDHSRLAAKRIIVDTAMLVHRIIAQIMHDNLDKAFFWARFKMEQFNGESIFPAKL